jgi:hypothetical protein
MKKSSKSDLAYIEFIENQRVVVFAFCVMVIDWLFLVTFADELKHYSFILSYVEHNIYP